MKSLFGFGTPVELEVVLNGQEDRRKEGDLLVFAPTDDISGTLQTTAKKFDHGGIKVELIGVIETIHDKSMQFEFTSSVRVLSQAGTVDGVQTFPFAFVNVDMPHESYYGKSIQLRYFVRATITRSYATNLTKEQDFLVHVLDTAPELNSTIKMEVGIEDCLHIEFEYNKSKYHLKDVVVGKVFFLLVRIKIKHMELAIVRREISGMGGSDKHTESETMTKFEIMDGAPVKGKKDLDRLFDIVLEGESIPVRLYLGSVGTLTPTFKNVNNRFSVKYLLNLVLVDEEDRRYFKQQEITLWRKD